MKLGCCLAVCVVVLGCTPEFVAPVERPGQPVVPGPIVTLDISIALSRSTVDSIRVLAYLNLRGDQGALSVENDTLVVDGMSLVPDLERSQIPGVLVYMADWTRPPAGPTMTVRGPRVRGAADPGALVVPVVSRTGPAELTARPGSDLLLPFVTGQVGSGLQAVFARTSVFAVLRNGVPRIHVSVRGEIASPWVIPGEWLSATPGDTLQIRFESHTAYANRDPLDGAPPPAGAYLIAVASRCINQWTILF